MMTDEELEEYKKSLKERAAKAQAEGINLTEGDLAWADSIYESCKKPHEELMSYLDKLIDDYKREEYINNGRS